ncbi:MAG TPA: HD domain-containing phosphohydrolase [Candidatus Polarisedimenticolaceae bacterium]|nr:HD domain-containing phosphohydrolase [Candidatus Polarisedimenticolaceae bacterium]
MADILLLSGDRQRASDVRALLRQDGHAVTISRDVGAWRDSERQAVPELIVAAVDELDEVRTHSAHRPRGFPAPLLVVQHASQPLRELQFEDRLVDRIHSPFTVEELLARVDALVRLRRAVLRTGPSAETRRRSWTTRVAALLGARVPRLPKPQGPYFEIASRAAEWSDRRDTFEPGHSERVCALSAMIADGLGVGDSEAAVLLRAAMLHDVGKIAMPVELLRQQGPLDPDQLRLLRSHPERGATLLRALDKDEQVAQTVLLHHERADGSGYYGRRREQTPRAAQILAVAETYDAMTTSLVKERLPQDHALAILRDRQEHYDGDCVAALSEAVKPRSSRIPVTRWP